MELGLNGARALVTGGSAGIGAAVARALAAEGARVAVAARPSDRLETVAHEIDGVAIGIDLSGSDGPTEVVRRAVEELGGLDALLVSMGGPPAGTFEDVTDEQWQTAIDMTFWSTVHLLRAALPHLRESRLAGKGAAGSICVILSSSVREPIPALTTSNFLRPGLVGLMKSMVPEIAPIRINGIAPGRVATGRITTLDEGRARSTGISVEEIQRQTIARIPMGRYGEPAEVGRVAAFLLSPAASYVTGAIVPLDGGMVRALP